MEAASQRRARLWRELRLLHSLIDSGRCERRGTSVENVLWEVQADLKHGETGIPRPLSVALLVNAFGFERRCGVEKQLWRMFDSFASVAEHGSLDWRELVCALHGLANPAHARSNPIKLLQHFWRLYALAEPGDCVATADVRTIVSMASISEADVARTAGVLDEHLGALADDRGRLQRLGGGGGARGPPLRRRVTSFDDFSRILVECPAVIGAFRDQLWLQLTEASKMTYLTEAEEASGQWFESYMAVYNRRKAVELPSLHLKRRSFFGWRTLVAQWRAMSTHVRQVVIKKTSRSVRWWFDFLQATRGNNARRTAGLKLAARLLKRRIFSRWARWVRNEVRSRDCCGAFKWSVPAGHAAYLVRKAQQRWMKRGGFSRWLLYIDMLTAWTTSEAFARRTQLRKHFRYWRGTLMALKELRYAEVTAARQQVYIFDKVLSAEREYFEQASKEAEAMRGFSDAADRAAQLEMCEQLQWQTRRRAAEKAADDRIKLMLQHEAREKRVSADKEVLAGDFEAKWEAKTADFLNEKKRATLEWLGNPKLSQSQVLKEFKRIRRDFHAPPTPQTWKREAQLKDLAAIVMVRIEALLFKEGIVLTHLIQRYDDDGNGFLSHGEFRAMLDDLPMLSLSEEQIRQVIKAVDADTDGFIGLEELIKSLDVVHEFNGHPASPWRVYIDPAQDVICYHNLHTDEQILEHKMTDARLMDVTKAQFLAEAELEAMNENRAQKAADWTFVLQDRASCIFAGMFRRWHMRKEAKRFAWKAQARKQKVDSSLHFLNAVTLQCWARRVFSRRLYTAALVLHFEVLVDLVDRRRYYCNHVTGESVWAPPRTLRVKPRGVSTESVLHAPHEFVLSKAPDGRIFFVRWDVPADNALQRSWDKPAGYARCGACLQNLALLSLPGSAGAFCFRCFREKFDAAHVAKHGPVKRVELLRCGRCERQSPAAWRCTFSTDKPKLVGTLCCPSCFERLARALNSNKDDAWARI